MAGYLEGFQQNEKCSIKSGFRFLQWPAVSGGDDCILKTAIWLRITVKN